MDLVKVTAMARSSLPPYDEPVVLFSMDTKEDATGYSER